MKFSDGGKLTHTKIDKVGFSADQNIIDPLKVAVVEICAPYMVAQNIAGTGMKNQSPTRISNYHQQTAG